MAVINSNIEIQKLLYDAKLIPFDGIDGKIGPKTKEAITTFLTSNNIDCSNWSAARKLVAMEQFLYKSQKISVGAIDGLVGQLTNYAREVYQANLTISWRDRYQKIFGSVPTEETTTNPSVWPLQRDCMSFYGKVGTNQVMCQVPFPLIIPWEKGTKLLQYQCHKKVKDSMERIWNRTFDYYGIEKIKELQINYFGGCLNVRQIRGGSTWSMHSWGIAVDIDPDRNELHTPWKQSQMSKPEYKKFVEFWYDEGAINLGKEANFDSMHFQFARLR